MSTLGSRCLGAEALTTAVSVLVSVWVSADSTVGKSATSLVGATWAAYPACLR